MVALELFPIFGHHMRKFYSLALVRQNRGVKFLELMQISPTRQDVICVDRDVDLEVRITWIFTRQPKELYSKESAAS